MKLSSEASPIDFTGLTAAQEGVLGLIAMNDAGGHHPKVLAALVKRGLIEEYEETLGGRLPVRVKRYRMPLHVHVQWCQWCSDSFDGEVT